MIKHIIIYACSLLLILTAGYAQERQLSGTVTVFDSIPVMNAQVLVKSADSVFLTNENGMYRIKCLNQDKIVFKAKGFKTETEKITEDTKMLNVNLKLKNNANSREIAYGYGHVKDRDKLFASSSMYDDDNDFYMFDNMLELIEGRFSGVDTYGGRIVIRGMGSVGDNSPLIMVDGVKVDYEYFNMIAPNDVKSIHVIKDGSTAMYGAEGANGVIVVETKRK